MAFFHNVEAIRFKGHTTAERDARTPVERVLLLNTETSQLELYLGGQYYGILRLNEDGTITPLHHGPFVDEDLHTEYAGLSVPEEITGGWVLGSGGSIRCTPGEEPDGELVPQRKTTSGAPTHSASIGTPCWVEPDDDVYVNNDGSTGWTKQAKSSDLHAQAHTLASHSTKPHSALTGVTADQHHVKYTDPEALAACIDDATSDPVVAGATAADGTEESLARKDHRHPYHASHGVTHNATHGVAKHTGIVGERQVETLIALTKALPGATNNATLDDDYLYKKPYNVERRINKWYIRFASALAATATFELRKNGTLITGAEIVIAASARDAAVDSFTETTLATDDYLEVWQTVGNAEDIGGKAYVYGDEDVVAAVS